eukprot:2966633-Pleurochrysis_carterae.AAC.1
MSREPETSFQAPPHWALWVCGLKVESFMIYRGLPAPAGTRPKHVCLSPSGYRVGPPADHSGRGAAPPPY